jgi:hypothetical protein
MSLSKNRAKYSYSNNKREKKPSKTKATNIDNIILTSKAKPKSVCYQFLSTYKVVTFTNFKKVPKKPTENSA